MLDAEAIALRPDGRCRTRSGDDEPVRQPEPGIEQLRAEVPLRAFVFDVLHLDGEDVLDRPASRAVRALDERLPEELRVPRIVTDDVPEAERFITDALARGHEGVMVKALDAPYEAGRRGAVAQGEARRTPSTWSCWPPSGGHGRRQGWLSNLHLGARDPRRAGS